MPHKFKLREYLKNISTNVTDISQNVKKNSTKVTDISQNVIRSGGGTRTKSLIIKDISCADISGVHFYCTKPGPPIPPLVLDASVDASLISVNNKLTKLLVRLKSIGLIK